MLQNMILEFLGTPPVGSEWLVYQYSGITFILLLVSVLIILFVFGFYILSFFRRG